MKSQNDSYVSDMTNVTSTISNATIDVVFGATWTVVPVFSLIICIFGYIGNGTLLFLFIKDRALRTPFNIYLINLLTANMFCLIVQYPMDIITNLHSFTWSMGNTACTVYLYANDVLEGASLNAHQLIAINRIWAVVHPLSYRSHHSVRTAVLFCVGMWVYVHLAMVPGWLADALYYRLPVETNGCMTNGDAQPTWAVVTSLLVFDWPEVVMILAFPIIYFTRRARRKAAHQWNVVVPNISYRTCNLKEQQPKYLKQLEKSKDNITDIHFLDAQPGSDAKTDRTVGALKQVAQKGSVTTGKTSLKSNSRGHLVLGLLVASVAVCWTPGLIYYLLVTFRNIDAPTYYQVATILFSCQTMLDPFLFTVALKSLRQSLRGIYGG